VIHVLDASTLMEDLQAIVTQQCDSRDIVRVLEAGCGSASHLDFGSRAHITGIDISPQQLERNSALSEKIVGDVESFRPVDREFDIVVCWDVLEHLPHPQRALANFQDVLASDGIMVLAAPEVLSLKGLATKLTPHALHRWVYRRWVPAATQDPFRTYLRLSISQRAILAWAARRGLIAAYAAAYEGWPQQRVRARLRLEGRVWRAARAFVQALSFERLRPEVTDFVLVLSASPTASTTPDAV
jgi:2-polyprenyl-3-methyl-5-hydroxy-6-metoxy-1,4-benzoquinol methylase